MLVCQELQEASMAEELGPVIQKLKRELVDHVAKSCLTHQPFLIGSNFTKDFNFLKKVEFLHLSFCKGELC